MDQASLCAACPMLVSYRCCMCRLPGAVYTWGDGQLIFEPDGNLLVTWGDSLLDNTARWELSDGGVNADIRGTEHRYRPSAPSIYPILIQRRRVTFGLTYTSISVKRLPGVHSFLEVSESERLMTARTDNSVKNGELIQCSPALQARILQLHPVIACLPLVHG